MIFEDVKTWGTDGDEEVMVDEVTVDEGALICTDCGDVADEADKDEMDEREESDLA